MRCQDIERLILEAEERELSREERIAVDDHLNHCAECAGFRDFQKELRLSLQNVPAQRLSSELDNKVRLICHTELRRESTGVPWVIWAALVVLTLLTIDFLIPRIERFWQDQKITLETALVLVLLLQNALMLFFAPVIMRGKRVSQESLRNQG
jgi:predicted anti-sigma-YlaC factor YlaD